MYKPYNGPRRNTYTGYVVYKCDEVEMQEEIVQ